MTDYRQSLLQYLKERDHILLTGTPHDLLALIRKYSLHIPSSPEVLEMTFHKTITGVKSLPIEHRRKSKAWLTARGLHSLDDGEL
jgi:hypothetical protein